MLLRELQSLLADSYRLDVGADVAHFLITDRLQVKEMLGQENTVPDEMLFIHESNGELNLSLFLDDGLLRRLIAADPIASLNATNLDDFCCVLEGVSHFVYMVWNARNQRRITKLELEIQAEIDKYMTVRLLIEAQHDAALQATELPRRLFDAVVFNNELEANELARYRCANNYALRFCDGLQERYPGAHRSPRLLEELRSFYRMPQADKMSHIHAAQFA